MEDEVLIREGVIKLVRRLEPDCEIVGEAADGKTGLSVILAQRPDLVITDVRMPDMDGLSMLEAVREQGCSCKAIVLTAYSEFDYAKQAVKLGVVEYLLKPIVMEDFIEALRRAKRATAQEGAAQRHPEALRSLRVIYRAILGGMPLDHEVEAYLQSAYGLSANGMFTIVALYPRRRLGDADMTALHALKQSLCRMSEDSARLIELASEGLFALVLGGDGDGLLNPLRDGLPSGAVVAAYMSCNGLGALRAALRELAGRMDMCLSLNADVLDFAALPLDAALRPLVYPIALESQARSALWERDAARLRALCDQFLDAVLDRDAPHRPREIKECCVRFFWSLMNTAAERDYLKAEKLERQPLMERVTSAVTREELRAAGASVLAMLFESEGEPAAPQSDMVARARAQVREFYGDGVTLEEIAARLRVTPEYLSQQFHRETGVKFSAYIRGVRIEKAKELLRVTDCKIYEVARRVGYADAKYFAKVFKAETGMMPVEYRAGK